MNVETEEIEYCKLHVKYEADPESVKEKRQEAIAELRKLAIPGFRPGKAPDYAVKARCKKQINNWVCKEMSSQAFDDVLFETQIKPIGFPKFEKIDLKDNIFQCEMIVTKKPDIELKEYSGFEIPRPHMDRDTEGQVQKMLEDIRTRFGDIEPYKEDDFVELGDQITMDFKATIDGKEFEGSTAEGMLYTVGENRWPNFDDNLLGATSGDEREFEVTFPDDLHSIGGKTAQFKVLIHMGTKRIPAPLDDELAQKVGLKNFGEVREKLAVIVNQRIQQNEHNLVRQQIINRLIANHDFKIPDWLLDFEAQQVAAQNKIDWNELGDDEKQVFIEQADKNLRLSLILDAIRDKEPECVLNNSEAIEVIKQQVLAQGGNPDVFLVESQKNGRLSMMINAARDEFTLKWLVDKSNIIDA